MSRKIKFRAWKMRNGKMRRYVCTPFSFMKYAQTHIDEPVMRYSDVNDIRDFMPDADIIEQYTGLKDKNGKKIYEGDIVFFFTEHFDKATGGFDGEDEHNAIVEWFDNGFAFMDKVPYDPNIECEVIGNIHENPELLGGQNEANN